MKRKMSLLIATLLCAIAVLYCGTNTSAQENRYDGRTITGTAYFLSGRRPGRTLPFTLIIKQVSSADEVKQLNSILQSGGQDDLLRTLSRMDAGRIQIGTGVGVTANAIIVTDEGDGRTKLSVVYQRDVRFGELRSGARSTNYPFGYAEMYLGRGNNEGMLIPAAKIRLREGNTWEVEDFGTFPARLMGLQVRGRGRVG